MKAPSIKLPKFAISENLAGALDKQQSTLLVSSAVSLIGYGVIVLANVLTEGPVDPVSVVSEAVTDALESSKGD